MSLYQRKITKFKYTTQNLSSLLKQKPQYGANEASKPRFSLQEPRYVRITDIDEYGLLKNNIGVTAESIDNQYILNDNDILFARSGATVGKTYIHKLYNINYSCFFAGYMIRFVVDETKISPDYVFAYTQLKTYSKWVNSIQRAAGQPNINSEEYKSLKIPIPPKEIQDKIVAKMDHAYAAKKQKELEAQQLLESIDDYLLGELGIELPEPEENTIKNRIFIRNLSEVSGDRFDPYFYMITFKRIEDVINQLSFPSIRLGDIFEINRGGSPRPINKYYTDSDDGVNWIKIGDTKHDDKYIYFTQQKIKPEGCRYSRAVFDGDFLLSNSMSFGKPYIMKTSGFIHDGWLLLRPKMSDVNNDYLHAIIAVCSRMRYSATSYESV